MHRLTTALALAIGLCATAAQAASLNGYTSFWAFGDSLSDPGNLSAATGGARPGAPYVDGRYSNGPVWAEPVATDFAKRGLPTGNFAYGGGAVGPTPQPAEGLSAQIGTFAATASGRLGARPVASLWIGANDILSVGVPTGTARAVGGLSAKGVGSAARTLDALGVRDVVLFNMPALDRTPLFAVAPAALREEARRGTNAFNAVLARQADKLRSTGMNVIEFDTFRLFTALLDDPERFGVSNATIPCHIPGVFTCDVATEAPLLAFFDPIHPNATIHAEIADRVRADVAPVPLPASGLILLAGLGAFGLLAVRRRAQGIGV